MFCAQLRYVSLKWFTHHAFVIVVTLGDDISHALGANQNSLLLMAFAIVLLQECNRSRWTY